MLIPLHLPSHWSVGHGVASVPELAEWGEAWRLPVMALTDVENLCGAVEFHHRCRGCGIRPILGLELRRGFLAAGRRSDVGRRAGRLVLLARDSSGYRSLCRIISRRRVDGHGVPAGDPVADALAEPAGIFALTDDPVAAARLVRSGFPSRSARLLLVRPRRSPVEERAVLDASRRLEIPLVADLDPVVLRRSDVPLLRLQRAIRSRTPLRSTPEPAVRDLPRPEVVRRIFEDVPDAVTEAARVADECESDILPAGAGSPIVHLPRGETAGRRLCGLTRAALDRARRDARMRASTYDDRLETELATIEELGLASWFIALDEIAAFARRSRIEILVRGSAAGSLVVHLLGLCPVDPVGEDLLFERFLQRRRRSPFDVDLDLPTRRREEVLAWVLARWGPLAAAVGAHQRFGPRSARRETAAVHDPGEPIYDREDAPGERLIGCPRGLSAHPGGVILGGRPIRDVVPLEMAPKGIPVTQLDGRSLDAMGVVKLDLLGNTCLDEIERAIALVGSGAGLPETARHGAAIPLDDPATLQRLGAGDTIGCSQIETPATRAALARRPIRSIDDVTTALASVRPGPSIAGGLLFEEDVMRLLSLGGLLTIEECDGWRATIVESGGDEGTLAALRTRYVSCAIARGATKKRASGAWSDASPFASYAFSKAHAASYAHLAYRSAFLRTQHPLEWGCAVLDRHGGAYLARTIGGEVARWGASIRAPAVNDSGEGSRIVGESEILLGLERIRGLSARTRSALLEERSGRGRFADLGDLVRRVRPGQREIEALVLSGSCDALMPLTADGYPFLHEAVLSALRSGEMIPGPGRTTWTVASTTAGDRLYRALVRARNELRYLGLFVGGHPLGLLRNRFAGDGCRTIAEVLRVGVKGEVAIAALPAATRRVATGRGPMRFVTWEDETGLLESRIAPPVHSRLGQRFRPEGAYRVSGRLRPRTGLPRLDVEELVSLEARAGHPVSPRTAGSGNAA